MAQIDKTSSTGNEHTLGFSQFSQNTTSKRQYLWALLFFLSFLFIYLYGNGSHSLWDRDEPRYADAAQTMFKTGQMIVPMFNGDIRYDKPVLVYWLMNIPMHIWGINEFSCRAVQALSGAGVVACVWILSLMLGLGMAASLVATLICGFSPLLVLVSKASTTDSILLLTIITALMIHWIQKRQGFSWFRHIIFWSILGISALQKGHPGLIVVGLTLFTDHVWGYYLNKREISNSSLTYENFSNNWRLYLYRSLLGIAVFSAILLPWVAAVWIKTDGGFFVRQFDQHVLGHAVRTLDSHWGPAFFYIPVLCIGTITSLPLMLSSFPGLFRQSDNPSVRFLLSWLIPSFFVFSLAGTKLPHYIIPILPALAILCAYSLTCWSQIISWRPIPKTNVALIFLFLFVLSLLASILLRKTGTPASVLGFVSLLSIILCWFFTSYEFLWKLGSYILMTLGIIIGLATPGALIYLSAGSLIWGIFSGFVVSVLSVISGLLWLKRKVSVAFICSFVLQLCIFTILFAVLLPSIESLRPSKPLGQFISSHFPENTKHFMAGYKEPSLVFYSGRVIRETGSDESSLLYDNFSDRSTSTCLVITKPLWDEWIMRKPELANVGKMQYSGNYFQFQKGGKIELLIISN